MGTKRGVTGELVWEAAGLGRGSGEWERGQREGHWEGTGRVLGALVKALLPADILLNVFLAIAVDNLADGDNINSGAEKK